MDDRLFFAQLLHNIKSLNRKACNFLVSKYFAMCRIIIVWIMSFLKLLIIPLTNYISISNH